ncbi:MAG: FAD-dependent monooxygenase [Candidatus Obscuribacter sp.]|nr:FAD-dependent monooxygenase [Candidatus Obscuribacter sp.]
MKRVETAIVIGGGIAGLTTALALGRLGIDVKVFEQADSLREVGAGLTVWSNGMYALDELGAAQDVLKAGQVVESFRFLDEAGQVLGAVDLARLERLVGQPSVTIHRRALLHALAQVLERTVSGCSIHLAEKFLRYKQDGGHVAAYFESGSVHEADILIGCDGFNSLVRKQVLGDTDRNYSGYTCFRGVTEFPEAEIPRGAVWHTNGVGTQFGLLHTGAGQMAWYATANMPSGVIEDAHERKDYLLDRFASFHELVPRLLGATESSAILKNDIYDRSPSYKWSDASVLLVGDAAHPTTPNLGQGACMALEDAAVLGRAVKGGGSVEDIFDRFCKRRMRRTSFVTRSSRRAGAFNQSENQWLLKCRDKLTAALFKGGSMPTIDKIMGYKI